MLVVGDDAPSVDVVRAVFAAVLDVVPPRVAAPLPLLEHPVRTTAATAKMIGPRPSNRRGTWRPPVWHARVNGSERSSFFGH
jgi:hypothetical protein